MRERISNRRGRFVAFALTAALACALLTGGAARAATVDSEDVTALAAGPKPQVTIQGNVVVDKGKPTGFYELALCVRTGRTVTRKDDPTNTPVPDAEYAEALAEALEKGDRSALDAKYEVTNYPFESAAAAVHINLDALTAVTWGAGQPSYDTWTAAGGTGTAGSYATHDTYPRGIDPEDPEQPKIFQSVTELRDLINGDSRAPVRLDTAKPDEVTNATAVVEKVYGLSDALLTLTANTTDNAPVVYETPTPVVVVRFAYDMARFTQLDVTLPNQSDFWVGLDSNDRPGDLGRTPLTYLGARDTSGAGDLYADSDAQAAESSVHQAVWYGQRTQSDSLTRRSTEFYYYLGADGAVPSYDTTQRTYFVYDPEAKAVAKELLFAPKTAGSVVLAQKSADFATTADPEANTDYSFFQNLLLMGEDTLRLTLVNAETYRKPTGGIGGAQILFYDWDDSLIGALVVDPEGDARAAVNEYVERTMIHPDLRTGDILAGAADLAALQADPQYADYEKRVNSLERQYTYRGDYAYEVGQDGDDSLKRPADHAQPGEDYPLTNKLDYAFYRRVTTQTEWPEKDPSDPDQTITRYYSTSPVSEGPDPADPEYDGYLYPYVYGWAIVEDESQDLSKKNWILRQDSIKTEDVWTTFGAGELADLDPAAASSGTIPNSTDPYTYAVTDQDAAWYLRFADFSAMEKMLRSDGDNHQDVLIVKAVYEPGTSLLPDNHYTIVDDSLRIERYSYAASTEESVYSFQYQYRRVNSPSGFAQGVKRTREPAVQTGYTYDVNAFDSEEKNLDPSRDTKAFFMKTISANTDVLDIDITAGGVLWRIDYVLVDTYGYNIATGVKRSAGKELDLKNNFLYEEETKYEERQGTDGFVLQATLNTLLTEATKGGRGEKNELLEHFSLSSITDLNFKADDTGADFTVLDYDLCATYLQNLVTRLYNDGVAIDTKTGDVKLGWHQIQKHILMCMAGDTNGIYSSGTLLDEESCKGFPWCRLDECSKEVKVNIASLGDIFVAMDKAKDETGTKRPATEALDQLQAGTPPLLDGYMNNAFRKDEDGRKFNNWNQVYTALRKVYDDVLVKANLDQDAMKQLTEDQVQEMIITGQMPTGKTYWWRTGDKTRPVSTWKDFIDAGILVATKEVPDALNAMTEAKLLGAVDTMISYKAPDGSPSNVGWFRTGLSEEDNNAFADVDDFKVKWIKALEVLHAHYDLKNNDWATLNIPWEEIQYALINGSYLDVDNIKGDPVNNYWWRGGGQPRLTYERLMEAASEWRASGYADSTKLDTLLAKSVNPVNNEVYIRRTAAGSGFTSQSQFKTALKSALQVLSYIDASQMNTFIDPANGALKYTMAGGKKEYVLDIYQFQYLLLNSSKLVGQEIPPSSKIADPEDTEVVCHYWWIPEPHTPVAAQRIGDIMDLLTYAYWAKDGVEVDGSKQHLLFDPLAQLDAATMERLKLRAEAHGMPYTTEPQADLRTAVIAAIGNWPYTIDNFSGQAAADLTRELQNLLLGKAYNAPETYWWQGSGFTANTHATLAQAAYLAAVGFGGKTAPDAMDQITDIEFISRRETIDAFGLAMRSNMSGTEYASVDMFKSALTSAVAAAQADLTYDGLAALTPHQLQYLLLNGVYKTDAEVKAEVIEDGVDAYWWFTADKPPETSKKEELFPDPDEWDAFLDSAIGYYKRSAGNVAGFTYDLTDAKLKDVLMLRKGPNDSDTITAAEMFNKSAPRTDLLWRVMTALHTSSRKSEFITGTILNRTWVKKPTWEEFQYVLIHLNDTGSGWVMPSTADCAAEKENYEWMWKTLGKVEYERVPINAAEWDAFLNSAIGYYKRSAGNVAGFVYDLTDDKLENTLVLRKAGGDLVTATEMFNKSAPRTDLLWRVMTALHTSSRKSEFITGTILNRTWVNKPTWEEFQYVLYHLNDTGSGWVMPSTEDCAAWFTQENAPWAWREKQGG